MAVKKQPEQMLLPGTESVDTPFPRAARQTSYNNPDKPALKTRRTQAVQKNYGQSMRGMTERVGGYIDRAPVDAAGKHEGQGWYGDPDGDSHAIVSDIAKRLRQPGDKQAPKHVAAAMLAVTSPQNPWHEKGSGRYPNAEDVHNAITHVDKGGDPEDLVKNGRANGLNNKMAAAAHIYKAHKDGQDPTTATFPQGTYRTRINKETGVETKNHVGGKRMLSGPKVEPFYDNLVFGRSEAPSLKKNPLKPVVDSHQVMAATGLPGKQAEKMLGSGDGHGLDMVAEATSRAGAKRGMGPSDAQSVSWITHQNETSGSHITGKREVEGQMALPMRGQATPGHFGGKEETRSGGGFDPEATGSARDRQERAMSAIGEATRKKRGYIAPGAEAFSHDDPWAPTGSPYGRR